MRNLRSFAVGLTLVAMLAGTTACTENTGRGAAVGAAAGAAGGFIYDKVTGND